MTVVHMFNTAPALFGQVRIGVHCIEFRLNDGETINTQFAQLMDKLIAHNFVEFYGVQPGVVTCQLSQRGVPSQQIFEVLNYLRLQLNLAPLSERVLAEMAELPKWADPNNKFTRGRWINAVANCLLNTINELC